MASNRALCSAVIPALVAAAHYWTCGCFAITPKLKSTVTLAMVPLAANAAPNVPFLFISLAPFPYTLPCRHLHHNLFFKCFISWPMHYSALLLPGYTEPKQNEVKVFVYHVIKAGFRSVRSGWCTCELQLLGAYLKGCS